MSDAAGFSKETGTDNEIYGFVCELLIEEMFEYSLYLIGYFLLLTKLFFLSKSA